MGDNMKYTVYFNYGYRNERELFESDDLEEAIEWAQENAEDELQLEGDQMEVAWFAADGEYMTEWSIDFDDLNY